MSEPRGGGSVRRLAHLAATLVYREIEVHIASEVTTGRPTLAVANHFGGLADGVLLVDTAAKRPRVVARDVIWKVPIVGRLATGAGLIPVHRSADGGARASNDQMFASTYDALGDGDLLLIFPEGVTQDVPHMAEVKTGAARIALGARNSGVPGIAVQPVGVHYENKAGFRSRALVNVGDPIDLDAWVAHRGGVDGGAEDREAVRELTADIDTQLRRVAPDYPDWAQAHALETVAGALLSDVDPAPAPPLRYGDRALLASRLNRVEGPARAALVEAGADYRSALRASGTSDRAVAGAATAVRSWSWLPDLALTVLLLPFALVGLVAAIVPLSLVVLASRLRIAPAVRASIVPALATLLFLVEWVAVAVDFASRGVDVGLLAALLFPFVVGALFVVAERIVLLWRRWRARRVPDRGRRDQLRRLRAVATEKGWAVL